jgi:DNA-nicking Smr family endonuclease
MRRLSPEEERLWARVVDSVRPLGGRPRADRPAPEAPSPAAVAAPAAKRRPPPAPAPPPPARPRGPGTTLDGSWDRRLTRGEVQPDDVLDLHGHDLATAYDLLDRRLEQAVAAGARLLLLVTGKAPGPGRTGPRGAIRASVGDWLAYSRHAGEIAAVRGAHRRHGGAGALYIVLRRRR